MNSNRGNKFDTHNNCWPVNGGKKQELEEKQKRETLRNGKKQLKLSRKNNKHTGECFNDKPWLIVFANGHRFFFSISFFTNEDDRFSGVSDLSSSRDSTACAVLVVQPFRLGQLKHPTRMCFCFFHIFWPFLAPPLIFTYLLTTSSFFSSSFYKRFHRNKTYKEHTHSCCWSDTARRRRRRRGGQIRRRCNKVKKKKRREF